MDDACRNAVRLTAWSGLEQFFLGALALTVAQVGKMLEEDSAVLAASILVRRSGYHYC